MSAVLSQPNNKLQLGLCAGSLENGPLGNRAEDGTSVPVAGDATKKTMVRINFSGDGSLKRS